jgi:hypothetical protein
MDLTRNNGVGIVVVKTVPTVGPIEKRDAMKKLLAVLLISALPSLVVPATAQASNPTPPAEWRFPSHAKYVKYKDMDCWRFWRITKCIKP